VAAARRTSRQAAATAKKMVSVSLLENKQAGGIF